MTTIESKDLVIGQEYYDIPDMDLENAALLKFIGKLFKHADTFEVIGGNINGYDVGVDNLISFHSPSYYYQP